MLSYKKEAYTANVRIIIENVSDRPSYHMLVARFVERNGIPFDLRENPKSYFQHSSLL